MKKFYMYETDLGKIYISEEAGFITNVDFRGYSETAAHAETDLIKEAYKQIKEYLAKTRKNFDLPLRPSGTSFQLKVWEALKTIPYGETRTYGFIAEQTGNKAASRAVGSANNKNPISIIIPCHRVIGANGKLVGYGGGINVKERLLNLEKY